MSKSILLTIRAYEASNGSCPYEEWLSNLKDKKGQAAIISRVDNLTLGIFGDCESVGEGVYELRIHYGPGYRVYYAREGKSVYLLLCAGSKKTQKKDIIQAKVYWSLYKRER